MVQLYYFWVYNLPNRRQVAIETPKNLCLPPCFSQTAEVPITRWQARGKHGMYKYAIKSYLVIKNNEIILFEGNVQNHIKWNRPASATRVSNGEFRGLAVAVFFRGFYFTLLSDSVIPDVEMHPKKKYTNTDCLGYKVV